MAGSHSALPTFADITTSTDLVIKAEHTLDPKSNRSRQVELLKLINKVVTEQTPNAVQIKLGMLLWLHLAIRHRENKGKEPYSVWREWRNYLTGDVLVPQKIWGSQVCYAAEQRLKGHQIVLEGRSSRENFLYLAAFKKFLTSHPAKEGSKSEVDEVVDQVIEDLELEYTAKPKQKEMVDRLLSRYPAPWFLHKEFDELYEAYTKYYNKKGIVASALHDPVRDHLVFFMCAANRRLGNKYNPDTREDHAYRIKLAMAIFVMHEVKRTYNLLPVDWSELHKLCSSISNLHSIDALNYEEQLDHFILLRQFLRDEIKHKTADQLAKEWIPLTAPSPFLRDTEERIAAIIAEIEVKKRSAPAPTPTRLDVVVATAKKIPGAAKEALIPQASSAVFGGPLAYAGGVIGSAIAGRPGQFVGSKLGGGLASIVLPVSGTKQALDNAMASNPFEAAARRIKEADAADQKADPENDQKRELVPRDTGNYNDVELRNALLTVLPHKELEIRKSFDMEHVTPDWSMVVVDKPLAASAGANGLQVVKAGAGSSVRIEEVTDDVSQHALVLAPAGNAVVALTKASAPPSSLAADAKAKGKPNPKPSAHVALALMPPAPPTAAVDKQKSKATPQPSAAPQVAGRPMLAPNRA